MPTVLAKALAAHCPDDTLETARERAHRILQLAIDAVPRVQPAHALWTALERSRAALDGIAGSPVLLPPDDVEFTSRVIASAMQRLDTALAEFGHELPPARTGGRPGEVVAVRYAMKLLRKAGLRPREAEREIHEDRRRLYRAMQEAGLPVPAKQ